MDLPNPDLIYVKYSNYSKISRSFGSKFGNKPKKIDQAITHSIKQENIENQGSNADKTQNLCLQMLNFKSIKKTSYTVSHCYFKYISSKNSSHFNYQNYRENPSQSHLS